MKKLDSLKNIPFEKHFQELQRHWIETSRAFDTFLNLTVDWLQFKDKKIEHFDIYVKMLADLINLMNKSAKDTTHGISEDILWEFYMNHVSYWEHWQYFTPQNISDMMAIMICEKPTEDRILDKMTVADPSGCWSGRMLLGAAKVLWKRNMIATAVDLDKRCCKMALINLFLNGIDANIYHMNWLSMEFYEWRAVRMFPFPRVFAIENIKKETKEAIKETIIKEQQKPKQMTLFDF